MSHLARYTTGQTKRETWENKSVMNAYEQGWHAAETGADFYRDNPHKNRGIVKGEQTGEWVAWRNGYRDMYRSCGMYISGPEGALSRAIDRAKASGAPVLINRFD